MNENFLFNLVTKFSPYSIYRKFIKRDVVFGKWEKHNNSFEYIDPNGKIKRKIRISNKSEISQYVLYPNGTYETYTKSQLAERNSRSQNRQKDEYEDFKTFTKEKFQEKYDMSPRLYENLFNLPF